MLARFGFADPDKREPLHDLACQYLASADTVARLVQVLGVEHGPVTTRNSFDNSERAAMVSRQVVGHRVNVESEIAKGEGRYRTTIGFADVLLELDLRVEDTHVTERRKDRYDSQGHARWSAWRAMEDSAHHPSLTYGIEVKIKQVTLGDLIRQVKLYRSYSRVKHWIAVTAYPLTASETECLRNEGIVHMRLGPAFDGYVDAQSQIAAAVESPEV